MILTPGLELMFSWFLAWWLNHYPTLPSLCNFYLTEYMIVSSLNMLLTDADTVFLVNVLKRSKVLSTRSINYSCFSNECHETAIWHSRYWVGLNGNMHEVLNTVGIYFSAERDRNPASVLSLKMAMYFVLAHVGIIPVQRSWHSRRASSHEWLWFTYF